MSIKNLLKEEIESEMAELKKLPVGSDESKAAAEVVTKLTDRVIEFEKLEADVNEKAVSREVDAELRARQLEDERKDKIIKNVLTGVSVVGGIALTIWGTKWTAGFEKLDSFTTTAGRSWANKVVGFFHKK